MSDLYLELGCLHQQLKKVMNSFLETSTLYVLVLTDKLCKWVANVTKEPSIVDRPSIYLQSFFLSIVLQPLIGCCSAVQQYDPTFNVQCRTFYQAFIQAQNQQLGPKKVFKSCSQLSKSHQKLDIILENKVVSKLKFSKNVNNKKCAPKLIFFNEKKQKDSDHF